MKFARNFPKAGLAQRVRLLSLVPDIQVHLFAILACQLSLLYPWLVLFEVQAAVLLFKVVHSRLVVESFNP